jgi:hypothetical protein
MKSSWMERLPNPGLGLPGGPVYLLVRSGPDALERSEQMGIIYTHMTKKTRKDLFPTPGGHVKSELKANCAHFLYDSQLYCDQTFCD